MNFNDPISDLLTRIRNGQKAGQDVVTIPASTLKIGVTHLLKQEGYIRNYKCVRDQRQGVIKVVLKYDEDGMGAITKVERVSRPGRRHYVGADKLPYVKHGFGVAILSTSRGLMTDTEAREQRVGGEYLCRIY